MIPRYLQNQLAFGLLLLLVGGVVYLLFELLK